MRSLRALSVGRHRKELNRTEPEIVDLELNVGLHIDVELDRSTPGLNRPG